MRIIIGRLIVGCVLACCLSRLSSKAFAIEGLKISVQSTNVVLSWPSVDDGSETYIIQYRPTLDTNSSWLTLTDNFPAALNTNLTFFIHTNGANYTGLESGGDTNGDGGIPPLPDDSQAASAPATIMAMPANGSGEAVPLAIYPIGFDLSGLVIFDPATGEWISGKGYTISSSSEMGAQAGGVQPMDLSDNTNYYTGFYRVVRDGAYIVGLTNGAVLSGIVTLPVELGNASGTLETLCITESNSPVGDSIQAPPNFAPLGMKLDTTVMPNGVHYLSAYASWDDTNGGRWEANSPTISVTTSNEITFEHYMRSYGEIGNTVLINATSAHPSTDWTIKIYDDHTNYLGNFTGHTDNGDIGVYWDYSNTPYTNSQFFSFEISTEYIDPPIPKTYKQNDPWIAKGAWAMAAQHAFDFVTDHESIDEEINGFAVPQSSNGGVKPPVDGDGNVYALRFNDPSEASTWTTFKNAIFDPATRNLVYFGHGGGNGIGYNSHDTNVSLCAPEIQARLHTIPAGQTNRHSFRFVFLDGCSTATGTLPESFGIRHEENVDSSYYYYAPPFLSS